jgi:hypothetical protein
VKLIWAIVLASLLWPALALAQQYVVGTPNLTTNQVTVGPTVTLIVAAHSGRSSLTVINQGAVAVCLGSNANVTSSTGLCLPPGNTSYVGIVLSFTGALYGIAASSDVVSFGELF